jgi:dipeptidyl aminopeptidase/acylaminoacyl peptidase
MNFHNNKFPLWRVGCFLFLNLYAYSSYINNTSIEYVSGVNASLVALSPKAIWVSWVQPTSKGSSLVLRNLQSREEHVASSESAGVCAIVDYRWINEYKIAYLVTSWTYRAQRLVIMDVRSGQKTYTSGIEMGSIVLIGSTEEELYIKAVTSSTGLRDLCKVDIDTGKVLIWIRNTKNIYDWIPTPDRGVVYAKGKIGSLTVLYKIISNDVFQPIVKLDSNSDSITIATARDFAGSDGFYACTSYKNNTKALMFVSVSGSVTPIYSNEDYDVNCVVFGQDAKPSVVGFYSDRQEYAAVGSGGEDFQQVLNLYKNERVAQQSADDLSKYIIFKIGGYNVSEWYAIYDRVSKTLAPLFDNLKNNKFYLPSKSIKFEARDGLILNGYLTLPPQNYSPPYPAVVLVHGGPGERDHMEAEPLSQTLARAGYLVIRVNFRGSEGYGKKFVEASNKQLGLKMQDDVTDAVEYAKKQGLVDSNRIAIAGSSYGGYSALMGLIRTPDLYRCAVSVNGPVDLTLLMEAYAQSDSIFAETQHEIIGDPISDKSLLDSVSPLLRASEIKKPVLLIQGSFDIYTRAEETKKFFEKLYNENCRYILYKDHHQFKNQSNLDDSMGQILNFLNFHMKSSHINQFVANSRENPITSNMLDGSLTNQRNATVILVEKSNNKNYKKPGAKSKNKISFEDVPSVFTSDTNDDYIFKDSTRLY